MIAFNIALALYHCHLANVIHRDVKLENIMISKNLSIRLIDFGYGTVLGHSNQKLFKYCGTPYYMPPEIILKKGYDGKLCLILRKTN